MVDILWPWMYIRDMWKETVINCGENVEVEVNEHVPTGTYKSIYPTCPVRTRDIHLHLKRNEDGVLSIICQEHCPNMYWNKDDEDQ